MEDVLSHCDLDNKSKSKNLCSSHIYPKYKLKKDGYLAMFGERFIIRGDFNMKNPS